jgi:nucleoside-diphosphate-sugar epimerase
MQVFVTGASGHIASAVIPELLDAGHEVLGLARSDASAAAVEALGAKVRRGSLNDLDGLRDAAAGSDGVIHLAFNHEEVESGNFQGAIDANMHAIEAMGEALSGTDKPMVCPSGTLQLSFSGISGTATESDMVTASPGAEAENALLALAERHVRSSLVRLPPTVHSSLDHRGYIPALIAIARDKGRAGYVGEGINRWPAVNTLDAAHLFRLAIEAAPAGSRLHGVAEEGVPFRTIAETIGRHLGVPTISIRPEDAADYFGFLALFVPLDNPTSSEQTQKLLDWYPAHTALIPDLNQGHYFETASK